MLIDQIIAATELIDQIIAATEDNMLTSSERKKLKENIKELSLTDNHLAKLRSQIFDLAQDKIATTPPAQVIQWLEKINKLLLPQSINNLTQERVYFSPDITCQNAIIGALQRAINSIQICVFTISANEITQAIIDAHKRNVAVKIITDNEKLHDKGSDIIRLCNEGIPIKVDFTRHHMHHKFALFDKKEVLTGSYNWTRSAALYNHENMLISSSPTLLRSFSKEFDQLWDQLDYLQA